MKKLILGILVITVIAFAKIPSNAIIQNQINSYTGFEQNLGQVADFENNPVPSVYFSINLAGYNIFIQENGASFVLYQPQKENNLINFARFDIEPVNGKIEKNKIEVSDEIIGHNNYYLAHCPNGIVSVKSYRNIKIKDLYPGINWVWRYDDKVHSEFEVTPNADINNIKLKVKWADTELKNNKELIYSTPLGTIKEGELKVYEQNGKNLSAFYKEDKDGLITFDIKGYDKNKTLIIDPPFERLWATYYGGTGHDNCDYTREMGALTTDPSGNIFVTGFTISTNFPTYDPGSGAYFQGTSGQQTDVFILKFSNTGTRQWATYYGGTGDEMGIAITTDGFGNMYVTGNTFSSPTFPVYDPGGGAYFQASGGGSGDVFILKFDNAGVRLWATYYGGTQSDVGYGITTDNVNNVFITGNTYSSNFPILDAGVGAYYQPTHAGGIFDAFILKFTSAGVRKWATYYGGNDEDYGYAITTDASDNVFITGMTRSTNFPILDAGGGAYYQTSILGYRTVFILKFTNNGVREWATYYGGSTNDYGRSITTDRSEKVYVTGNTSSTNFPTYDAGSGAYYQATNAGSDDAFILRFSNTGVREWATYYGGTSGDFGRSITTDNSGNIFITGNCLSTNFPTYDPGHGAYYQSTLAGGHEAFILGFNNSGIRRWATFYGGASTDYGMSIKTDGSGNIFLTGFTLSTGFPTYNPGAGAYFQGSNAGSYDAYVLKFAGVPAGITENRMLQVSSFTFQVFPNPAKTYFTIRLPQTDNRIQIYDVSGKIIKEIASAKVLSQCSNYANASRNDNTMRVSLDGIKSGVYFVKVTTLLSLRGSETTEAISKIEKLVITK